MIYNFGVPFAILIIPDSKVHRANMGPTWDRQDPCGPHVGHVSLAIWGILYWKSLQTTSMYEVSIHMDNCEISHKVLNPCTAKYAFHWLLFSVLFIIYLNCDVISLTETVLKTVQSEIYIWQYISSSLMQWSYLWNHDKNLCMIYFIDVV